MEIGKKPPPPALPPLRSPQVGQHRKAKTSKSYLGRPAWTRHTCPPQKRGAPDFSAAGIDPLLRRTEPGSECADRLAVGRNPGSAISLRLCSPGGPTALAPVPPVPTPAAEAPAPAPAPLPAPRANAEPHIASALTVAMRIAFRKSMALLRKRACCAQRSRLVDVRARQSLLRPAARQYCE